MFFSFPHSPFFLPFFFFPFPFPFGGLVFWPSIGGFLKIELSTSGWNSSGYSSCCGRYMLFKRDIKLVLDAPSRMK